MAIKRIPQPEPVRGLRETDDIITALRLDGTTNELLVKQGTSIVNVLDFLRQKAQAGQAFTASFGADVDATTGTLDLLLVTPNTNTRVHLTFDVSVEGEAAVNLYEAVVATAADAVAAYNRDRNSAVAASLVVTSTPTAITEGEVILRKHHPIAGGVIKSAQEIILKKNTSYLLRVANATAAANQVMVNLDWFEI